MSVGVRVLLVNVGLLSGVVGRFVQLVSVGGRFRCESVVGLEMGVGSRFVYLVSMVVRVFIVGVAVPFDLVSKDG